MKPHNPYSTRRESSNDSMEGDHTAQKKNLISNLMNWNPVLTNSLNKDVDKARICHPKSNMANTDKKSIMSDIMKDLQKAKKPEFKLSENSAFKRPSDKVINPEI